MKKLLSVRRTANVSLLFASFLFTNLSYAQHWRTGGNGLLPAVDAPTALSFVGTTIAVPFNLKTTLAQPINFSTSNVQRMTITPTGLVGVGNL